MSFGLANAPAHFQRTMSRVLAPLLGVCALVYIDDIIVYSRDRAEHVQHLHQVCSVRIDYNLNEVSVCSDNPA